MEVTYQQQWESNQTWGNISGAGQLQRFASNSTENRTNQMTAEEGGELQLEPFLHIQREADEDDDEVIQREADEEEDEGGERQNMTSNVERMLDEATEMREGKLAEGEKIEGGEEANVIKASKTIDEALNEIDDSYWKRRVGDQKETLIREKYSETNEVTTNHSEARNSYENQPAIKNAGEKMTKTNPWSDHSHEEVNRTMRLIKEKNKASKIEEP